jgi:hypothetical protein
LSQAQRAVDGIAVDDPEDDRGLHALVAQQEVRCLADAVPVFFAHEADTRQQERAADLLVVQAALDDLHGARRDRLLADRAQQVGVQELPQIGRGPEVDGPREQEVVGVGPNAVHERRREARILGVVRPEPERRLLQILRVEAAGGPGVLTDVEEAGLEPADGLVVVDEGQHGQGRGQAHREMGCLGVDEGDEVVSAQVHALAVLREPGVQ